VGRFLFPWTVSIHDFEPITGRIHQPPPSHQTFQGQNFVICSFCPRKLDFDPLAVPIPYHHSNLQSEEMIYYVSGKCGSRRGVDVGSITLHPSGLPHPSSGTVTVQSPRGAWAGPSDHRAIPPEADTARFDDVLKVLCTEPVLTEPKLVGGDAPVGMVLEVTHAG
jgi:hypothetical protein